MPIPKNRQVKNSQDVVCVITYAIHVQEKSFTTDDIVQTVEELLKFSVYGKWGKHRKELDLKKRVKETIRLYYDNDWVEYDKKTDTFRNRPVRTIIGI